MRVFFVCSRNAGWETRRASSTHTCRFSPDGDRELAHDLFTAEVLSTRLHQIDGVKVIVLTWPSGFVDFEVSRVTSRRSRQSARLKFWRRSADDVDVYRDEAATETYLRLRDVSRRLRCEGDRRVALLNPSLEVFQGKLYTYLPINVQQTLATDPQQYVSIVRAARLPAAHGFRDIGVIFDLFLKNMRNLLKNLSATHTPDFWYVA